MSTKQEYMNKNKNPFKEYEEQLKNGTAKQISHYTNEQLKEMVEKEEQAQKDPSYIPDPYIKLLQEGIIHNVTPDSFTQMIEMDTIPKELAERWLKDIEDMGKRARLIEEYRKKNPNATWDEIIQKFFKPEKTPQEYCIEPDINKQIFEILWGNRDLLNQDKIGSQLFLKGNKDDFGISNILADTMYHLIDLLGTELKNTYGDYWEAKGTIKDSYGREMRLEYSFQATTKEDAEQRLDEYKHTMRTKGIKTWMAYWKVANERGRPEYTCPFIEVMKCLSDENREAHFSTKEKQECWEITKILKRTTIKMYRPIRKNRKRWVEQPMVDILGGENEDSTAEKYPLTISVRVLSTQVTKDEFAPIIYKSKTLGLNPNDVLLAYVFQTRGFRRGVDSNYDWNSLYQLGNVQKTAEKNTRMAKSIIRRKLKNMEKAEIIEGSSSELLSGVRISPKDKKTKPIT